MRKSRSRVILAELIVLCSLVSALGVPVLAGDEYQVTAILESPEPQSDSYFGFPVDIYGDTMVVGESWISVEGFGQAGKAHTYDINGTLRVTLQSPAPHGQGMFGRAAAISGDIIIVGEPGATIGDNQNAGRAYIYNSDGSLRATIQSPNQRTAARFGRSLCFCGDRIVVGEPYADVEGKINVGKVHLYDSKGNFLETLQSPEPVIEGRFGHRVGGSEDLIVVSEQYATVGDVDQAGKAYLFDSDGDLLATLQSPDPQYNAGFSRSVAVSGDIVVVGEYYAEVDGKSQAGRAHVFDTDGNLLATLQSPEPEAYALFGSKVDTSGGLILVGEPSADGESNDEGRAYVFDTEGNLLETLSAPEPTARTEFGSIVFVKGDIIVVGEYGAVKVGRLYVFQPGAAAFARAPTQADEEYNLIATLHSTTPCDYGGFGGDIALSEDLLLIGEPSAILEDGLTAGRVYVFDSNMCLISNLTSPTPQKNVHFGRSIDVKDDIIVVSDHRAQIGNLEYAGEVHVFDSSGALLYTLQSPQPERDCRYGREVAIGKDIILIGHCPDNPCKGTVHIYDLEETYLTTLTTPSLMRTYAFGDALAANEGFIAIGEPRSIGNVYVFDYDWNLVKTLQSPYPQNNTKYGNSVAFSENYLVVGEMWATVDKHEKAGRAYIYDSDWNLLATLQSPNPEDNAEFGIDVAVEGNIIVVGECFGDVSVMNEGKAHIFDLEGNLVSTLTSPEPSIGAQFGWRVDTDGEIIVIAEVEAHVGDAYKAGIVYIFQAGAADFTSSGLTIDPGSVRVGDTVTISVECCNEGSRAGSHTVTLKVDGEVEDEKTVTLDPGDTTTVSFEVSATEEGSHSVDVSGLTGSYEVRRAQTGILGFPVESIIAGLAIASLAHWLHRRRS